MSKDPQGPGQPKLSPVERYLNHLDEVFQMEPEFFQNPRHEENLPAVTSIVYKDVPENGYVTGLTYGLSIVKHPDWLPDKRGELIITVKSTDIAWARVAGYIANGLRGDCPFSYGQTINFGEQIADDSEMDAFLIFAPAILEQEDFLNINVGTHYSVNISGLYPIYASEMELIQKWGLEKFWHHEGFDPLDVQRPPIRG